MKADAVQGGRGAAVQQSPCERGHNAPLFPRRCALTLLEAKRCQLRLEDAQPRCEGQRGHRPSPLPPCGPAGAATCICAFYSVYLFAWLISPGSHSQARCVLLWKKEEESKERKKGEGRKKERKKAGREENKEERESGLVSCSFTVKHSCFKTSVKKIRNMTWQIT